ncbi:metal-sensing transcriptional repressor [Desulforamulus ruminis]|nr:metal-sensing transcriptional repressor [Desulforamulus ruminis]
MRECMDIPKVRARLKRIEGQVRGISEMVDKDIPCDEIMIQINAAKSALHKVGQIILEGHLQHCVRDGIEHGDADKTIKDFAKAVEHFSRLS